MARTHNLGFPRIGAQRELKFALESYWQGESSRDSLQTAATVLRQRHWAQQSRLDFVPVGDFSLYDQVLDMSFMLGNLPQRVREFHGDPLDNYFRVARGRSAMAAEHAECCGGVQAGEMTKWFDTNYHYIVPEFEQHTRFSLNAAALLRQIDEARRLEIKVKPVIIGPVTYLFLGKSQDGSDKLRLLPKLLSAYVELLATLAERNVEWVQIDEPVLVMDLEPAWREAYHLAYDALSGAKINILLATYFGALRDNLPLACSLPIAGLHLDTVTAHEEVAQIIASLPDDRVVSLGVVNGRNIWKTDLNAALDWLEPIAKKLGDRLWIAPSCSLLHVPVDLDLETGLGEIRNWLAFAKQKLEEIRLLAAALKHGRDSVSTALADNKTAIAARHSSSRVHDPAVKAAVEKLNAAMGRRQSDYAHRVGVQSVHLKLPAYPTTTIGSFPQTAEIRQARSGFKSGKLDEAQYRTAMHREIERSVLEQEHLGLDVLVHGEAERNDMVEYFGEQLHGYAFSQFGWVQSYGSRCVKPPILFGDISRPKAMTVDWIQYAQSLTDKPVKGMLTGPVTILNWSFVRDDQPRSQSCYQLALAIRAEVLDLEKAGIRVIQIDEAALREGLPLRRSQWTAYLAWAVESFRIAANGVADATQIHTHMCYSEFNDIIEAIAAMDADVITIETSRSNMELLDAFETFRYPNEIGPGVYDIHSPNIPTQEQIVRLMTKAAARIPAERLWINPDCGLKTRTWPEVIPALANMVAAAKTLRATQASTVRSG